MDYVVPRPNALSLPCPFWVKPISTFGLVRMTVFKMELHLHLPYYLFQASAAMVLCYMVTFSRVHLGLPFHLGFMKYRYQYPMPD